MFSIAGILGNLACLRNVLCRWVVLLEVDLSAQCLLVVLLTLDYVLARLHVPVFDALGWLHICFCYWVHFSLLNHDRHSIFDCQVVVAALESCLARLLLGDAFLEFFLYVSIRTLGIDILDSYFHLLLRSDLIFLALSQDQLVILHSLMLQLLSSCQADLTLHWLVNYLNVCIDPQILLLCLVYLISLTMVIPDMVSLDRVSPDKLRFLTIRFGSIKTLLLFFEILS